MNKQLMFGGVVLALLMVSMPANAYHITGVATAPGAGSAHDWDGATQITSPVAEPCSPNSPVNGPYAMVLGIVFGLPVIGPILFDLFGPDGCFFLPGLEAGDLLFALNVCEQDDVGFGFPQAFSKTGNGGLCTMSPGYDNSGLACVLTAGAGGRSNGNGPNYDGVTGPATTNPCEDVNGGDEFGPIAGCICPDWFAFRMTVAGLPQDYTIQVNGIGCDTAAQIGEVDMLYAYVTDDGHVAGFASASPGPGVTGTYEVASITAPSGALCVTGTPAPIYWAN